MLNRIFFVFFLAIIFSLVLVQPALAAAVTGQITYKGKPPKLKEIKMDADPICLTHHNKALYPSTITLGPNNEMKNVFVYISEGLPKKTWPAPAEPLILNQKGCVYDPAVFGVMVGQPVKILNPDGTLHNVHCLSKVNPEFNLAMPKFRTETTQIFNKPEMRFQIKCDVHPWMVTWGNVLSHPYYAVTDAEGKFKIENLPAGNYVLEAWQQRLDPQKVSFTVTETETKDIPLTFQKPDGT